jgi:hypothetical protein
MLAVAGTIFLLSPIAPIPPPPPLAPSSSAIRTQVESRFPGHAESHERIEVGVRPEGTPVRIVVTQRLDMTAKGDYYFVIPAPATRVVPGPGSESQPGLRDLGIVWQGFANKNRVLSATATLKLAEAAPALPLRISVERGGDGWTVRLANATGRRLQVVAGQTTRAALQRVLAQLRAAYQRTPVVAGLWQVAGQPATSQARVQADAPLRVRGTLSVPGRPAVPVDVQIGGRQPRARVFTVAGAVRPRVRLRVELVPPLEILPTAAELDQARDPLLALQAGLGSVATSWWYTHYLDTPDAIGRSSAVYAYRTVRVAAPPVATSSPSGGGDTLAIVLGIVLGAAGLVGLAVLWARS